MSTLSLNFILHGNIHLLTSWNFNYRQNSSHHPHHTIPPYKPHFIDTNPHSPHNISLPHTDHSIILITQHLSKPHFIDIYRPSPHKISFPSKSNLPRVLPSHNSSLSQNNLHPIRSNFGLGTSCSSPSFIASQLSTQLTHFELHVLLIPLCPTTTPLYPTPTLSTPHLNLQTLPLSISAGRRATRKRTVPMNSSRRDLLILSVPSS